MQCRFPRCDEQVEAGAEHTALCYECWCEVMGVPPILHMPPDRTQLT